MIEDDSSETRTVCECNHLTHFAILLTPKPSSQCFHIVELFNTIIDALLHNWSEHCMFLLVFFNIFSDTSVVVSDRGTTCTQVC